MFNNKLAAEMHDAIVTLGGTRDWFSNRKSWLSQAADRAGISVRTAKGLFYREYENPTFALVQKVREAAEAAKVQREESFESEAMNERCEMRTLRERLRRIEAALGIADMQLNSVGLDPCIKLASDASGKNRALDGDDR